jgi:hypothetical protein
MKIPEVPLKPLLSASGAILVVAGVLFFALPSATLSLYGTISLTKLESILAQSLGGAMVGLLVGQGPFVALRSGRAQWQRLL